MLEKVFEQLSIGAAAVKTHYFELFSKIMELTVKPMSIVRQVKIALNSTRKKEHEMLDPQAVKQALIQILDQGFFWGEPQPSVGLFRSRWRFCVVKVSI